MFWFIILLVVAGAGFYFYQKLTAIEREIRAEQAAEKTGAAASAPEVGKPEDAAAEPELAAVDREPTIAETPVPDVFLSTEDEILAAVENLPGIQQAELHESFPDIEKKKFQQLVKKLADNGSIRREKQGSSYLIFPV